MYKIVIADDHEVFLLGLKSVIQQVNDVEIVGEASNGNQLLEIIETKPCDLIILDLSMPEMNGFEVLGNINQERPDIKCLILSMHIDEKNIKNALSFDIAGYIHKEDIASNIQTAIAKVRSGEKFFSDSIKDFIIGNYQDLNNDNSVLGCLTKREKEIAEMVVYGNTNQEISEKLYISNHTVQFHRSNILKKLNLKNSIELVKCFLDANLIKI